MEQLSSALTEMANQAAAGGGTPGAPNGAPGGSGFEHHGNGAGAGKNGSPDLTGAGVLCVLGRVQEEIFALAVFWPRRHPG